MELQQALEEHRLLVVLRGDDAAGVVAATEVLAVTAAGARVVKLLFAGVLSPGCLARLLDPTGVRWQGVPVPSCVLRWMHDGAGREPR